MGRTENLIDPPLTEKDAAAFYVFYEKFLKKGENDALSLMKSITLLRRTDLREHVHNYGTMRRRLETMMRETRQRDLLLSFPSTVQRVHELLWESQEVYGDEGSTVNTIIGGQATDYLDQTEMFRVDLDSLLGDCPSLLPEDRQMIERALQAGFGAFLYVLIAIADHVFLALLPYDHPHPTEAILKTRTFLQQQFGEKFEDQIIEFFVIGGGYLQVSPRGITLSGVHPVFDPVFEDFGQPNSERLLTDFVRGKYRLTLDVLHAEFPGRNVYIQG